MQRRWEEDRVTLISILISVAPRDRREYRALCLGPATRLRQFCDELHDGVGRIPAVFWLPASRECRCADRLDGPIDCRASANNLLPEPKPVSLTRQR